MTLNPKYYYFLLYKIYLLKFIFTVVPAENQVRQPVMVSTAHIHWDPEYSDVKLIQTMMLISELKKIIEETIQNYKLGNTDINTIPLILCGDLNSLPDSGKYNRL